MPQRSFRIEGARAGNGRLLRHGSRSIQSRDGRYGRAPDEHSRRQALCIPRERNDGFHRRGQNESGAKVVPLDEAASGTIITPESAKRLAAWLEKAIAAYDNKNKKESQYMDFRVLANGEVSSSSSKDGVPAVPEEYIQMRFQYVYNEGVEADGEVVNYYLGGGKRPNRLTYNEIKILLSSLQKP